MSKTRLTPRGAEGGSQQHEEVQVEDSEMIPKSRKSSESWKAVRIHEFAALARSSLHGISQAVKEHVTKPTSLAQGRVAHLIEWKGWTKTSDPSDPLHAHFTSYCHLSEGEQEARFAAGVAEQFAIAEAKLLAWASVDEEEEEEDSNDEGFGRGEGRTRTLSSQGSDAVTSGAPCQVETGGTEAPPSPGPASPPGSDSLSLDGPVSRSDPPPRRGWAAAAADGEGGEDQPVPLRMEEDRVVQKADWRPWLRSSRFDSCYSTSHSESPGEEDEDEEDDAVFQDGRVWHGGRRGFFSDRASSGVGSLDEEEAEGGEDRKVAREHLI